MEKAEEENTVINSTVRIWEKLKKKKAVIRKLIVSQSGYGRSREEKESSNKGV